MRKAIFPGVFDPFTVGHESIVRRGLDLFDEIIIALGNNSNKQTYFTLETRMEMIRDIFKGTDNVFVEGYDGLTVNYAKSKGAEFILRGIRTSADFEYERAIAQVNKKMTHIESVFLLTTPEHTPVNSTIVREILKHGGDVTPFIPENIDINNYL